MKDLKKKIAYLMLVCLMAVIIPVVAGAAVMEVETGECGAEGDNLTYAIRNKEDGTHELVISGTGNMKDFGAGIDNSAPWSKSPYAKSITSLVVERRVTSIGDFAFWDQALPNLLEAALPEGIVSIGTEAFMSTKLSYIRIPSTVRYIGQSAFAFIKVKELTIPASLEKADEGAFIVADIGSVYYPGSREQFEKIVFGQSNNKITGADIHFGQTDTRYDDYIEYGPYDTHFKDVAADAYYRDAVDWAVDSGMTTGVGDHYFGVGQEISRAEVAVFLYYYAKSSDTSTASGFTDVPSGAWYAKQVTWLTSKKYAAGTGNGQFSPAGKVTRAEAVTFLMALSGGASKGGASFSDVPEGSWYFTPVSWAVENGITSGSGGNTFSPSKSCTREQFVMMLYKLSQVK